MIGVLEIIGGLCAIFLALGAVGAAKPDIFQRLQRNVDAHLIREARACRR